MSTFTKHMGIWTLLGLHVLAVSPGAREIRAGRVDAAFVLGLEEQDSLVGTLLLKEAGALMGGPDGSPGVTPEGRLMAAGPRLYKTLVQTLQPHL